MSLFANIDIVIDETLRHAFYKGTIDFKARYVDLRFVRVMLSSYQFTSWIAGLPIISHVSNG